MPQSTALLNTCALQTPNPLINQAFQYAKDNIARCMRYYTLGWGMSNAPHNYAIVVGRDTGWMCIGIDYVAPWFASPALAVFRDRQKPNGQILEYVDMESGVTNDYGLNIADNTPFYLWALWHHWQMYADERFRAEFLDSARAAAEHLIREIGPNGLLVGIPAGTMVYGITSWRNIIPDGVIAGEVTEINALSAMALRLASEFVGEPRYAEVAHSITEAINGQLWTGENYLLMRRDGVSTTQVTGDTVFPVFTGIAPEDRARLVLERLGQPDFWTERGLRTVPNTDPQYQPDTAFGLLGGSWPNLTLWYAAAIAPYNADRTLDALLRVARPVVEPQSDSVQINPTEFAEWFDGNTSVNRGMRLSPWVAPTFVWAVMEGLLGLTWQGGKPDFQPRWPSEWDEVSIQNMLTAAGPVDVTLRRGQAPEITARK